jgi:hypothetical protein
MKANASAEPLDPSPSARPRSFDARNAQGREHHGRTAHPGALLPTRGGLSAVPRRHVGGGTLKPARPGVDYQAEASGQDGGRPPPRPSTHRESRPPTRLSRQNSVAGARRRSPQRAPALGPRNRALPGRWPQLRWARARTPVRSSTDRRPRRLHRVLRQEPPDPAPGSATHPRRRRDPRAPDPGRLSGPRPYRTGAPHALRFTQGAGMTPPHVRQRTAHPAGPGLPPRPGPAPLVRTLSYPIATPRVDGTARRVCTAAHASSGRARAKPVRRLDGRRARARPRAEPAATAAGAKLVRSGCLMGAARDARNHTRRAVAKYRAGYFLR